MPGQGKYVEREWSPLERKAITEGTAALGLDEDTVYANLGETCLDMYLNDQAYWRGVPKAAWEYRIGGYQVIKKWLSYRDKKVLGRDLTMDEVRYVTDMARRITALLLLQPELDRNYEAVKAKPYPWPGGS